MKESKEILAVGSIAFDTIDTPNGKTSRGVCIKCCEVKHYFNSIDMLNINRRSGGRGISLGGSKSPIT